jgi:hypothetical protein
MCLPHSSFVALECRDHSSYHHQCGPLVRWRAAIVLRTATSFTAPRARAIRPSAASGRLALIGRTKYRGNAIASWPPGCCRRRLTARESSVSPQSHSIGAGSELRWQLQARSGLTKAASPVVSSPDLLAKHMARSNPSLQPTCYSWLRQPPQAAELKR